MSSRRAWFLLGAAAGLIAALGYWQFREEQSGVGTTVTSGASEEPAVPADSDGTLAVANSLNGDNQSSPAGPTTRPEANTTIRIERPDFAVYQECTVVDGESHCQSVALNTYEQLSDSELAALAQTDAYAALQMSWRHRLEPDELAWRLRAVALSGKTEPLLGAFSPPDEHTDSLEYDLVSAAFTRLDEMLHKRAGTWQEAPGEKRGDAWFLEQHPELADELDALTAEFVETINLTRQTVFGEPLLEVAVQ